MCPLYSLNHLGKIATLKKNINQTFFYKKIVIDWPQIFGTSTITCRKDILKIFLN